MRAPVHKPKRCGASAESWPPRRRRDASSMASAPDSLIDLRIGEPALHAQKIEKQNLPAPGPVQPARRLRIQAVEQRRLDRCINQIVAPRLYHGLIMTSTVSTPHRLIHAQVSILVEIQIHDTEVRKASAAQQRFYQIFRAISSEKLHKVEAHHTMTHSKLMKQRSQPAWKSSRDIHEPPRHREPTRSRGQRRVDGLETPRHRADAATATASRRWRGPPEI